MKFKCEHCSAQYMIADEKVGDRGVRVRCKKCGEIITVKPQADEDDATTSVADQEQKSGRDDTEVSQSPDDPGEERDETTVDQPSGDEGFDLGDDEELGSAFDSLLGDEDGDPEDDQVDYDRQSTRVFNMEEMAKVQEEKDQAANDRDQISDLYHSARESERTGPTSPGGEDRDKQEWYAAVDEQQVGPMSAVELEERFRQEEFDADTLVWKSGFDDWLSIAEVDVFRHLTVAEPEPPPPDADEKTIAWGREQESEDDLGIDEALGAPQRSSFEDEAELGLESDEVDYGDDTEGLYEDEEASAAASAAAFAGADVDWKPSAIANLNTLAEEELASLAPPEESESESEFPFGDDGMPDGDEEAVESSEMEEGDSSIIGQIAAEEEAAARRAEEERQVEERRAEEARKKQEEQDLAAQEAARREREEEQRDKAAPPPEQILQPRSGFPKWAIGLISGVVGVIVLLLGFIAYKLASGTTETAAEHKAQPMTPPTTSAAVQPAAARTSPGAVAPAKEVTTAKQPPSAPAPAEAAPPPKPDTKLATAEAAKPAEAPAAKPAPEKKSEPKASPKRPSSKRRKKRTASRRKEKDKPAAVVREPPPIAEPPPPPPKPKPRRKQDKGGLLDFDDEAAFAEVTGSKTASARPAPKPVKKELPPLSDADVMAVMRNHVPEFKACNRKQKTIDSSVRGKMVVSFTISPSGKVSSATTKTARFKSTFVSSCITKVIKQLRFPKFGGKPKRVPFPFTVK